MNAYRERVRSILTAPEAAGNRVLALSLALDTDDSPDHCISIMAAVHPVPEPEPEPDHAAEALALFRGDTWTT